MTLAFPLFGLIAGALTTVAGQGGGLLLLLVLSMIVGPHQALAITAPALLLGNLHRAVLLRADIDRRVALRVIAGAVPGAIAGGLLVGVIPAWSLRVLLVGMTLAAIAKALGLLHFRVPRSAIAPAGALIGAMTGTSGGAGVLFAPMLLSIGLSGRSFVATSSAVAFATHAGRVLGYAKLGLFERSLIVPTVLVVAAILVGNAVGSRLHTLLGNRRATIVEYVTLVVCVLLSVAGLG